MTYKLRRLLPTRFELLALGILDITILLLSNSKVLLDHYGLDSSNQLIHDSTSHVIGNGLRSLDGFSLTSSLVTFLIWAVVGVFCFSIIQTIARAYHDIDEERALRSNRYIHPSTLTSQVFWRQTLLNFGLLLISLVILAAIIYVFVVIVIPVGLQYSRQVIDHASVMAMTRLLIVAVVMYACLVLTDICLRILAQRHRLVNTS